jgi:hypothetical protein
MSSVAKSTGAREEAYTGALQYIVQIEHLHMFRKEANEPPATKCITHCLAEML